MGTTATGEDPDKMQDNAAFHGSLHYLLWLKQSSTEIHRSLENSTRDPLKYKMDSSILIVSVCVWENLSEDKGLKQVNMTR